MTDSISAYVLSMERRGLAYNTIDKRRRCLRLIEGELGLEFKREQLEEWLDSRELCAKSRAVWLSHLHSFFVWGMDEEHFESDPTARIRAPKVRRKLPRPMSDEDLGLALSKATPLLRLWLLLEAFEGLRCQEVAGLRKEDVMVPQGLLRVTAAKGGEERVLPLHPEVRKALKRCKLAPYGPLFLDSNGNPVRAGAVSQKLGNHLRSLGITSTPHSLRHFFATNVYGASLDLRLTQELLGHKSVATTSIYAAADMRKAAGVVGALGVSAA